MRASARRAATSRTRPWPRRTTISSSGIKRLTTETGAGQWGSALAFACKLFGLECKVFMVRISFDQKPFRKLMMQVWGAQLRRQSEHGDQRGPQDPRAEMPGYAGQPGHRDQRGHRGGRHRPVRQDPLLPGQRAQPRAAASDDHRPGGQEAVEGGRGETAGHRHRLCRRRKQLRRTRLPVHGRQDQRRQHRDHSRRAGGLPEDDPRPVRTTITATPPA